MSHPRTRFLPYMILAFLLPAAPGGAATLTAAVTVDAGVTLNTFAPISIFGTNVGNWIGKADYVAVRPQVQAAGNFFLRFPGGSNGDDYHWNGHGAFDADHRWVPDDNAYSPGFSGSLMYRGTTSSYGIPSLVTDGNPATRWLSCADTDFPAAQWVYVDLGGARTVNAVTIVWGTPRASLFNVQYWPTWSSNQWSPYQHGSDDWQDSAAAGVAGVDGTQGVTFTSVTTRYVRVLLTAGTVSPARYSIAELYVYNGAALLTTHTASVPVPNQPAQSWTVSSSTDPASLNAAWYPTLDFESFVAYTRSFSPPAVPIIGVNFGSGTPQEAAAWVHYANSVMGYGIRYWQIGNEMEGSWETGGPLNTRDYARRYLAFHDAMFAEDPGIIVTGPVAGGMATSSNLYDDRTTVQDFIAFLHAWGRDDALNAIDFHWYPNWGAYTDAQAFASLAQMDAYPVTLQNWLAGVPGASTLPVLMTEFNVDPGNQNFQVRLADGLWAADAYGRFIRGFGDRGFTNFFVALGGGNAIDDAAGGDLGYLQVAPNAYQYQEHATYWAMKLMTNVWARPADAETHALVSAESSQALLRAYADRRPDGVLSLMVVNEDPANAYAASVSLAGLTPNPEAAAWRFDSSNYAWVTAGGPPYHADPDTEPTVFLQTGVAGSFPVTFGPYSITVLQFTDALVPTNTVTSTPTVTPSPTPTATQYLGPVTLVDDFEDPARNGLPPARANLWGGPWETSVAANSVIGVVYDAPGADGTSRAARVTGTIGVSPTPGWSNLTTRLYGGWPPPAYDAAGSGLTGIQFWFRGDGAEYRVTVPSLAVTDYNHYGVNFTPPAGQWTFVRVEFLDMTRQAGWGSQTGLPTQFAGTDVQGVQFTTQVSGAFDYRVDQVAFYDIRTVLTLTPTATVTPTPTRSRTPTLSPTDSPTVSPTPPQAVVDGNVKVDHFGYRTGDTKIAYITADPGTLVEVRDASSGALVHTLPPAAVTDHGVDPAVPPVSGDHVWWADFTALSAPGTYFVAVPAFNGRSYDFTVSDTRYQAPVTAALKSLYWARCGTPKTAAHGGNWTDGACHPVDAASTALCATGNHYGAVNYGTLDLSGGWHDAGDYEKKIGYSVNCAVTETGDNGDALWYLLTAYEENPGIFPDDQTDIPESGNGVPDILDEAKWELDWYLRMQQGDGHVLSAVHVTNLGTLASPPSADVTPRGYMPPCYQSEAIFTALTAHAARVLSGLPALAGYAATLRAAAELTWNTWVRVSPDTDPWDLSYTHYKDLKFWAAAEMFRMEAQLGGPVSILDDARTIVDGYIDWSGYYWLSPTATAVHSGMIAYLQAAGATPAVLGGMRARWSDLVNYIYSTNDNYNSGMDGWMYVWGSNNAKVSCGNALYWAARLGATGSRTPAQCLEHAEDFLHYLSGANPLDMLYMTNTESMGAKHCVWHVFGTWFGSYQNASCRSNYIGKPAGVADPMYPYFTGPDNFGIGDDDTSLYGPPPGYVPGGPTYQYSDGGGMAIPPLLPGGTDPPLAREYRDWNWSDPSGTQSVPWIVNEAGISTNAAYLYLASLFGTAPAPPSTPTPTVTATASSTPTVSMTATPSHTASPTDTLTPTETLTASNTPTATFSPTSSHTPTLSPTASDTPTATWTATPTPSNTPSASPTPESPAEHVLCPNPSDGMMPTRLLLASGTEGEVMVRVFTTACRKVLEIRVDDAATTGGFIPLGTVDSKGSALSNGVYYVVVETRRGRDILKWLVLR